MSKDDVLTQEEAWRVYDRWLEDERVGFLEEPVELEVSFRAMTRSSRSAPKDWADSYLAAFALASQLTLVTFDQGFRGKARQLVMLKASGN
jgi:predicted nucleic acid-binding protein